jgi:predicted Zn-dependent protease
MKYRKLWEGLGLCALAGAGALSLGACAVNPATGGRMFSLVSEDQEIAMGQQASVDVDAAMGLYDDEGLGAYVDSIGQAIAAVSERPDLPWSFKIVDDPVINAFALPGGPVYVARGIMGYFNSEAELASVLGHEIGHITARHSVEQISRAQLAQLGLFAGTAFVPELAPFADALGGGLGLLFLKFGRDDESQSDLLGFRYMTRLGYDPQGAVDMFLILDRQSDESGGSPMPQWASTHPDPGNRVADAEQRIIESGITSGIVRRDEYLRRIHGMIFGPDPRQGYFQGSLFLHPELKFQVRFPEGWDTQNAPQAVLGQAPDRDAAMQLSLAQGSPEEAAQAFFSGEGITRTGSRSRTVNGLPAVQGTFQVARQQGTIEGEVLFVRYGDLTYQFLGYTTPSRMGRYAVAFERSFDTFAPLTDRRLLSAQPRTLEIVTLSTAMSGADYVQRYPSTVPDQTVLVINGIQAGDWLEAGHMMKRVVGEGAPEN